MVFYELLQRDGTLSTGTLCKLQRNCNQQLKINKSAASVATQLSYLFTFTWNEIGAGGTIDPNAQARFSRVKRLGSSLTVVPHGVGDVQ